MASAHLARSIRPSLILGMMLMGLGGALLLANLGFFAAPEVHRLWPVIPITIGIASLFSTTPADREDAVWWIGIGAWFLVINLTSLRFRDTWPAVLIVIGASTIWSAVTGDGASQKGGDHAS